MPEVACSGVCWIGAMPPRLRDCTVCSLCSVGGRVGELIRVGDVIQGWGIEHEKTGLICDGSNLNDIYSSINSMLENKKYLELGKNAKEFVNKFQWSKIIEEYKKILS